MESEKNEASLQARISGLQAKLAKQSKQLTDQGEIIRAQQAEIEELHDIISVELPHTSITWGQLAGMAFIAAVSAVALFLGGLIALMYQHVL